MLIIVAPWALRRIKVNVKYVMVSKEKTWQKIGNFIILSFTVAEYAIVVMIF